MRQGLGLTLGAVVLAATAVVAEDGRDVRRVVQRRQAATAPREELRRLSGTVTKGAWRHYGPFRPAGSGPVTATLAGGYGDADLYVRRGASPTSTLYDCRANTPTSSGSCTVRGPGPVYVAVQGYSPSSTFALEVRYTPSRDDPATKGQRTR